MRVLVTGGTGFVGSHTVAALLKDGHEVRLLVRNADRIARALEPFGYGSIDHVVGDATDASAVRQALDGCEAVVHAAAIFSLDTRASAEMKRTNARAADVVLTAAVAGGCDPIVHVSSTVALLRRGTTITPDSALSTLQNTYVRSKVAGEETARRLQHDGAPVVTVYPGSVYGPHDPHLSDNMRRLRDILRGRYPMWPRGGFHAVDVRDVARTHAAALTPGSGPRRYIVPGHFLDGPMLFGTLRMVTGRRLPYLHLPAIAIMPVSWAASAAQPILPMHLPADHEGVILTYQGCRADSSRTEQHLGVAATPLAQTMADAARWLHQAGHISARQAGTAS
jgi:nucleoside-diphosphate-sugar epimerase